MRIALWVVAALFALASASIIFILLKGKNLPAIEMKLTISDVLNVALLFLTLVSLYIAVAAYSDAKSSGEAQQQILESSRHSLEVVVQRATDQQELLQNNLELLEQNLETARTHLEVTQSQWKSEQEKMARRAQFELTSIGTASWNEIEEHQRNIALTIPPAGWTRLEFRYRNTGKAPLVNPIYVFYANSDRVFLDQAEARMAERANHNRFQFSPGGNANVLPFAVGGEYNTLIDVTVPPGVDAFDLTLHVTGESMEGPRDFVFHCTAVRQQP